MRTLEPHDHDHEQDDDLRTRAAAFVRAERAGDGATAESALRGLFRALPSPRPAVDFAARVVASVPAAVRRRVVRDLPRRHRWLVAAAALCFATASAYLLPLAVLLLGQLEWGATTATIASWLGAGLGQLLTLLDGISLVLRTGLALLQALLLFVESPQVLVALALSTLVAGASLRLLQELLHSPRNPAHASS